MERCSLAGWTTKVTYYVGSLIDNSLMPICSLYSLSYSCHPYDWDIIVLFYDDTYEYIILLNILFFDYCLEMCGCYSFEHILHQNVLISYWRTYLSVGMMLCNILNDTTPNDSTISNVYRLMLNFYSKNATFPVKKNSKPAPKDLYKFPWFLCS